MTLFTNAPTPNTPDAPDAEPPFLLIHSDRLNDRVIVLLCQPADLPASFLDALHRLHPGVAAYWPDEIEWLSLVAGGDLAESEAATELLRATHVAKKAMAGTVVEATK